MKFNLTALEKELERLEILLRVDMPEFGTYRVEIGWVDSMKGARVVNTTKRLSTAITGAVIKFDVAYGLELYRLLES